MLHHANRYINYCIRYIHGRIKLYAILIYISIHIFLFFLFWKKTLSASSRCEVLLPTNSYLYGHADNWFSLFTEWFETIPKLYGINIWCWNKAYIIWAYWTNYFWKDATVWYQTLSNIHFQLLVSGHHYWLKTYVNVQSIKMAFNL